MIPAFSLHGIKVLISKSHKVQKKDEYLGGWSDWKSDECVLK